MIIGKWWRELLGRNKSGIVEFEGVVTLGASGAIDSAYLAGTDTPGFTVTKTGSKAGRYDVQLVDSKGNAVVAKHFTFGSCTVENPGADAAYTTAKGAYAQCRNNLVNSTGAFQIQLVRTDTAADAEAMDSAKLHIRFSAKFSSATP